MKQKLLALLLVIAILVVATLSLIRLVAPRQTQSVLFMVGINVEAVNPQTGQVHQWEANGYGAGFSPDGKQVTYATADASTTYIWLSDGVNTHKIAEIPFFIPVMSHMTWSDDGRKVAFLYKKQLVVVDVDTGEWHNVANSVRTYAWRPHNQQMAFVLEKVDNLGNIEISLLDLAQQTYQSLLLIPQSIDHLTWSPDGDRIAIAANKLTQLPFLRELIIVDVDSGVQKKIYSDTVRFDKVLWSPDGQNFMIQAYNKILLVDLSGEKIQVVTEQANYRGNTWSPDGKFVAYLKENAETRDSILAIFDVESGIERVLVTEIPSSVDYLAWR